MKGLRSRFMIGFYNILRLCIIQLRMIAFEVFIGTHSKIQLVSKFLLQVSVQKLRNSMVSSPEEGEFTEARNFYNNIIISYSTL